MEHNKSEEDFLKTLATDKDFINLSKSKKIEAIFTFAQIKEENRTLNYKTILKVIKNKK